MVYSETHNVTFTKRALRAVQDSATTEKAHALIDSVMTKSMTVRGWSMEVDIVRGENGTFFSRTDSTEDGYRYVYSWFATIAFLREDGKTPSSNELAAILRTLATRSSGLNYGGWTLTEVDGSGYVIPGDDELSSTDAREELIGYSDVEIPEDFESHFAHLFGRDAHVARIKMAIEAAIMSDWRNRFNAALIGPPGCGKSDICASLKRALGEDAVMEFDATATTAAGAIKELAERDILPRIMVVEEIEKADEKSLSFLLALCDLRGEIRKTTARATIQRDIKMVVIATVNNLELFEKIASGALASRFANKIGFSRPTRDQLAMILNREVAKINGDTAWIKPALDYCEEQDITDPRQVIALCLCGREKLVTGEYQKMLAETAMI